MRILGIDPGIHGALAVYDTSKKSVAVIDMPLRSYQTTKREKDSAGRRFADGQKIADWIEDQRPDHAVIESVHSFGKADRDHLASLAKFLTAFGVVLGSVQAMLGKHHSLIPPPAWKRRVGLIGAPKEASHTLACKLFPRYIADLVGPRGGARIDRAEALLIAYQHTLPA